MNRSDSDAWLEACLNELTALKETKMYVPVHKKDIDASNIVGCRWVFALKRGLNGEVEHYKARIIAKGFSQVYKIDYSKTFALVVKWSSIQILLALATHLDLEVHQMDVTTAFLNGKLEHKIFMQPCQGTSPGPPLHVVPL